MSLSLHFKELGQGDPLIILHGLFGSLDNWMTLGRKWAENYHVFLLDLRNHGKSPHVAEHTYPAMAQDIAHFISEQGLPSVALLGHSMGGKVAMQTALQFPDLIHKLLVADMSPRAYERGHDDIFRAMEHLNLETIETRKAIETTLMEQLNDQNIVWFLSKNIKRTENGFDWKFNRKALYESYNHIIDKIEEDKVFEKPTLFLRGERSDYVRDADKPLVNQYFPTAKFVTINGAGHWLHADQPKHFLEEVSLFLQEV